MNQRKLSTLWSTLFAVMMMLVGVNSASAQAVLQTYDNGSAAKVYESNTCDASTLQAAFNAGAGTNPIEVRLLAPCTVTGTITVSKTSYLTAGSGAASLTVSGTGTFTVNNNTTLNLAFPAVNDQIDLIVAATATMTINGTLNVNGIGNTVVSDGGVIVNNGTITNPDFTNPATTTIATDPLGALLYNSTQAPAGVYYETGTLTGTGTWSNIFATGNWSPADLSTYKMSQNSYVVIAADLALPSNLTFSNGTGVTSFDFVHTGGDISGTSTLTIDGNYTATTATPTTSGDNDATFAGTTTVKGFMNLANATNHYDFGTSTLTVQGDLTVGPNAIGTATPLTTVWGNVTISDDDFNPALTMSGTPAATLSATTLTSPLTSLVVTGSGKSVTSTNYLQISTMTNTGTFTVPITGTVSVTTLASNSGTISSAGIFNVATVTSNAAGGNINVIGGTTSLTTVTSNAGTIATSATGSTQIGTVTNSGTVSTAAGSTAIITVSANTGTITNAGGTTDIYFFATNSGTVSVTGGTLEIFDTTLVAKGVAQVMVAPAQTFTNVGTLNRGSGLGLFIINGNLNNQGNITGAADISTARGATVTANYVSGIVTAAVTDGIIVKGNFDNSFAYSGNVIVDGNAANRTVSSTTTVGSLTTLGVAAYGSPFGVTLVSSLTVTGHLVIAQGDFNISGRVVTVNGNAATTANQVPLSGVYVGNNARWIGATVIANGNRVALGQVAVAQVNGPLQVTNNGQVQLASNVFVASADITAGSTVKRDLGAFCFDFNVAGSTVGVVLQCGVFTITNHTAGSIRAQLIAAGYDPDNVNASVQIAIGDGNAIALTDVVAETSASTPAPVITEWKGVTIVDSQKSFILSSGTVILNDANLTLRGAFMYDGDWSSVNTTNRTRMLAGSLGTSATGTINVGTLTSTFANNAGGYLVFNGLQQPNANFIFTGDGVNSTLDGFVLRRVSFNRTGASPIAIVDNNGVNPGTIASSLVVSEKLLVNGLVSPGDNNIKWIGSNQAADQDYSTAAQRVLTLGVSELVGTGYFWLANNDQGSSDRNTITVSGIAAGTNLKMQFRKSGNAGISATVNDKLANITAFGNGGMSYVEFGYLQSGAAFTTVNSDMTIGANRALLAIGTGVFELQNSVTFTGNLFINDRNTNVGNNPIYSTNARLYLATGAADRETVVTGTFQVAGYSATANNVVAGTGASTRAHNLKLNSRVLFGAENEANGSHKSAPGFNIARPSRVIFAGSTRNLEYINGVTDVRIQRVQFNTATGAIYTLVSGTNLHVNDLLMSNGLLNTNGGLGMFDLAATDSSYSAVPMENFSIVTRAARTAEISRGSSTTGAYKSFNYASSNGAPYTLQYTGSADRFTGDEVPGLPLINQAGASYTRSNVNRLVMDAEGAVIEFHKDLVVNNRLEMLNGTVEIVTAGWMDLGPLALWVQGAGTFTTGAQAKFRFPSNSANSVYSATAASRTYDLFYVNKVNHTTGFEYSTNNVRHLTLRVTGGTKAAPVSLTMSGNKTATGTVRVIDGVLDLNSTNLTIGGNLVVDGLHNANGSTAVNPSNNTEARVSAWFPVRKGSELASLNAYNYGVGTTTVANYKGDGYGSIVDTNGTLTFAGPETTPPSRYLLGYVQVGNERFSLPNIVNTNRALIFDLNQGFTQGYDQSAINEYRVLSYTQNGGSGALRPGLINGVDGLNSITHLLTGYAEAGYSLNHPTVTQRWNVVNDFTLNAGEFGSFGATMTVGGNYTQGQAGATKVTSIFYGGQNVGTTSPDLAMPVLNFQVVGNFTVLEDKAPNAVPNTSTVNEAQTGTSNTNVHRFYLSYGTLKVGGNYSFFGHADITHGIDVAYETRGFVGTIEFNGTKVQEVNHVQVTGAQPAAYKAAGQYGRGQFNNVVINGAGISIAGDAGTHMYVNKYGVLELRKGIIYTGAKELVLFNDTPNYWNANSLVPYYYGISKEAVVNNGYSPLGSIFKGGSNSFVQGNIRRFVTFGWTNGGANSSIGNCLVDNYYNYVECVYSNFGYAFPLGHREGDRDYYRPMTLSFPANLGETISVVASSSLNDAAIINPSLNVAGVNGTLRLNKTSGATWNVNFEKRPALEPNIRMGAQGVITNPVANVSDMRIVARGSASDAWRMFGQYDLNQGTNPDNSYNPNDWIDGIPTFWQEGVNFFAQSVSGPYTAEVRLATSEPFNPFTGSGTVAYLQVVHNSPAGAVDVLVNDAMFIDNFAYQTATAFTPVSADTPLNIALKTANGETSLLTISGAVLESGKRYILIAQGGADGKAFEVKVVDYARSTSTLSEAMQFFFSHGVTNGPAVNVERVTTTTPRTLEQLIAVNAAYGSAGNYLTQLNPGITTLQLKAAGSVVGQYLFDFGAYAGKSMTLLATGRVGGTGANQLMIIGVDADGKVVKPQVTTSNEVEAELPAVFTVHGNYPNPFNPTTNVRFDLPEQANVRIEVVDVIGRKVMTVAPQTMSAGANKVITIDAARLSSGTYFYRVVAEGATRTFVQGSKFTLVK